MISLISLELTNYILVNQKIKPKQYVSWNAISSEALARTTPLSPPTVNIKTNPNANSIEGVNCNDPP